MNKIQSTIPIKVLSARHVVLHGLFYDLTSKPENAGEHTHMRATTAAACGARQAGTDFRHLCCSAFDE